MDTAIGRNLRKTFRQAKTVRFLKRFGLFKKSAALIKNGYWDQFRAMSAPCLLLHGSFSDVLPESTVEKMKAVKPEMQVITVADRGHVPRLDEAEVLTALDTFLAGIISR